MLDEIVDEVAAEVECEKSTGPRLTKAHLESIIQREHYHVPPHSTLTICVLFLRNGFTVTGESACVSVENFNPKVGRYYARRHAFDKLWQLEGYLLRESLYREASQKASDEGANQSD